MAPRVHVTTDPGPTAGELLLDAIRASVRETGRCRFGVPGGSSPVAVFRWLADHLDPTGVVLTWVDERHLPTPGGDWRAWPADSNRRLAWEHWLSRVEHRPREVPLDAPGTLAEAHAAVSARYEAELGGLDVVLLGAGPDGHVASLFPGHPALELHGPVLAIADSPKPPAERLTWSLPALEQVRAAVLVSGGADKAPILARALAGDRSLPLGRYAPRGRWDWVVDRPLG